GGTLLRLGALFGARSVARFARHRGGHPDLRLPPAIGFLQRDFEIVAEILPAIVPPAAAAAAACELAEQIVENVGERGGEIEAEPIAAAAMTVLEGRVAEAIIGRALLIVLQDIVGFADLLEANFCRCVAVVAIRMMLFRELSIGALDGVRGRAPLDAKNFVITTLVHASALALKSEIRNRKSEAAQQTVKRISSVPPLKFRL